MNKYFLLSVAILGLSVTETQANEFTPIPSDNLTPVLTFNGEYNHDDDVDYFDFVVNSKTSAQNPVAIWIDTLKDGLDVNGWLFKKNPDTGAYDYVIDVVDAFQYDSFTKVEGKNSTGFNDYGIAMKNGFEPYESFEKQGAPGVSDPGRMFPEGGANGKGTDPLMPGEYRLAVVGFLDVPNADFYGTGTLADGFTDLNLFFGNNDPELEWSTWKYNADGGATPHQYEVYLYGDVSAVPVPAAVWLFASAVSGLGVFARRKAQL